MKKPVIIAIIIAVILIAIIGGVFFINSKKEKENEQQKEPITAIDFKSFMENKEHFVVDAKNQFLGNDNIKQVYIATNNSYSYKIEFYELIDNDYSVRFYDHNKSIFETSKTDSDTETNEDIENSSKYTLLSNNAYKIVSRKGNTVIYVDTSPDFKDIINNILNEIGY